MFLELAKTRDLRVHIVTTRAPIATLERWLSERQAEGGDVSEADHHVLNSQRRRAEELDASERSVECVVDTALCGDRAAIESALRTLLQPCPISS
jgi:predicted kinase